MSERRTTKAERKEQARREREEIQRRASRARRNRRVGVSVLLVLTAGAIAFAALRPRPDVAGAEELIARAPEAARTAGCTDVSAVGPYQPEDQDRAHGELMPPVSSYPSVPPASGPHADATLPAGVYDSPPILGQALHSLEHGAVVVWYEPSAPATEVDRMVEFFRQPENRDHTIVAPYDYSGEGAAGTLPGGAQMALVSWHHVQTCSAPSLPVAASFADNYRAPPLAGGDYLGDAPEAGQPI